MKTIAVDFDGTLCVNKWPEIGEARQPVIDALIREQENGAKLILWTCREGADLQAAIMWCLKHDLKFDAVNDNLEESKEHFGNNSRKIWASEYWDDKSVIVTASEDVTSVVLPQAGGGVLVKKWINAELKPEPQQPIFIPKPFKRKKRWWQIWRSE